ncbi:MAG: geranylgeranylglyceryl/heptaprenylglyceryl phosphate synthase [Bacteroidota bacterium]
MRTIYLDILAAKQRGSKLFALLIDPDQYNDDTLDDLIFYSGKGGIDFFLIGGSLVTGKTEILISEICKKAQIPVLLYPGSLLQLTDKADGVLLLSLISGRNPELLIGNHVLAAPFLKRSNMEIIPTGYILVEGDCYTSVEYISQTRPIPRDKKDIILSTALAGEMLGMKMIYLEAGSGAKTSIDPETIRMVHDNIDIPLIVGGGICSGSQLRSVYQAGADLVVVGTAVEDEPAKLEEFTEITKSINQIE